MAPVRSRTSSRWYGALATAIVAGSACSLQDFEYLQAGADSTASGGVSAGGTGGGGASSVNSGGSNDAGADTGGSSVGGTDAGGGAPTGEAGGGAAGAGGGSASGGTTQSGGETSVAGAGEAGAEGNVGGAGSGGASQGGSGPTGSIVNPSFEESYAGWTFDPISVRGAFAYVQWPPTGGATVDGAFELSTWSQATAFQVKVYQVISGLTDGKYTFKGYFNRGDGHVAAYIYAAGCGGEDRQENVPLTAPAQWLEVGIGGIDVVGGKCEVGFFVSSNPENWLNTDAFSFEKDPQ